MICHTLHVLTLTAGALPVAVILTDFPVLLVSPIGLLPLTLPRLPPASFATVSMSAITGPAHQEHRVATVGTAKKLSKWNLYDKHSRAGVDNGKLS